MHSLSHSQFNFIIRAINQLKWTQANRSTVKISRNASQTNEIAEENEKEILFEFPFLWFIYVYTIRMYDKSCGKTPLSLYFDLSKATKERKPNKRTAICYLLLPLHIRVLFVNYVEMKWKKEKNM